jgi:uncharacterized protein (TIGR02266 family)
MNGRIATCIEAEFRAGGRAVCGTIRNVSEGGLFVRTRTIPEEGDCLDLHFRLPGSEAMQVSGLVWWTRGRGERAGFGLRVLDDSAAFRQLLAKS